MTDGIYGCDTCNPVDVIDYRISVYHDAARSVTCWVYSSGGIACLPDSELEQ